MSLEHLECRELLSGITVSDASAVEGSSALKFIDRFVADLSGGLARPRGSIFGPDGNGDGAQDLYVASADTNQILRYDGRTGSFLGAFVTSGSGGLNGPLDLAFGPDGMLYITSLGSGEVLRYNSDGTFADRIASGLSEPHGLDFGPDGSLYIANQGTDEVLRYSTSGLSVFVSSGSGGLDEPRHAVFGPDGNLYVASLATEQVLRYSGSTGTFIDVFATTNVAGVGDDGPMWIEFGADGYLYATARATVAPLGTSIVRFNAASGAFVDNFPMGRDGWSFILGPGGLIYNSGNAAGNFVERIGPSSLSAFSVSLSSASTVPVTVNYETADGTALSGSDFTAVFGTLTFAPGETTKTILVSMTNNSSGEPTESFTVNLSSPVGATIADGQGVGTIRDDDATRFYVVNDAGSGDRTYEYGTLGASVENYGLNVGNTAPRGAASRAAGDKVWVVDDNKKVYVYNAAGGSLGSWTAGSLASNATVEGIATNGTDVWIVDAKQDKVFRYTGAASRLSGSQNAASSFSLNSGNSDPKDIVTDGTSLWVVNDSSTDKVFKYGSSGGSARRG